MNPNSNPGVKSLLTFAGIFAPFNENPRHSIVPATYIAGMYSGLGDLNKAFQYLEQGYTEKNDRIVYLGVDPIADPLRADPRFSKLMKKAGLK